MLTTLREPGLNCSQNAHVIKKNRDPNKSQEFFNSDFEPMSVGPVANGAYTLNTVDEVHKCSHQRMHFLAKPISRMKCGGLLRSVAYEPLEGIVQLARMVPVVSTQIRERFEVPQAR